MIHSEVNGDGITCKIEGDGDVLKAELETLFGAFISAGKNAKTVLAMAMMESDLLEAYSDFDTDMDDIRDAAKKEARGE